MVAVANAAGIFHSFNYTFDDPNGHIQELSTETKEHMDTMPPFITSWQAQDIANNEVGGYYQNPMQSVTMLIYENANAIYQVANLGNSLANVKTASSQLMSNAMLFLSHTGKLSGVIEFDGLDSVNPYMDMAMSVGRTAMYITYQTDGITNNAPIMGSFTSLMIGPQLNSNNDVFLTYKQEFANSITITTVTTTDPETGNSISTITATSNLSSQQLTTLNTQMNKIKDFMNQRRVADVDFYNNVKYFVDGYNKTKRLNNVGETEKYLINNLIGTEKAKSRIA
jgi:patatin-like phospholipase/acyl hydrolase